MSQSQVQMTPHLSDGGVLFVLRTPRRSSHDARLSFWRDFVHSATRIHRSVGLHMITAGDANVWHPHFIPRHCDSLVLV